MNHPLRRKVKISKVERYIRVLRPLKVYLEGMKAAGGLSMDTLSYESPKVIQEIIEANENRLRELKDQDKTEKEKVKKKK